MTFSFSRARKATSRRATRTPFAATAVSPALLCALATGLLFTQTDAVGRSEKNIVHVRLPHSKSARARQLGRLGALDVLGIDASHGIVDVRVTPSEMQALLAAGLDVSFAPQDALVPLADNIDRYLDADATAARLREIEAAHRDLARVFSIGKTREGRDILAIELSRQDNAPASKPTALFNSMHHARELMTTEVAVDIAETLVAGYGKDQEATRWLDDARIVVVPQVNPDGNALVHGGSPLWRKNAWRQRQGGGVVGVDLNRNYPSLWGACDGSSGSASSDTYRGPTAASEPETQAMMKLVGDIRPLVNISYHSYSELIIYPYGCRSEKNPSRELFASIGARMREGVEDDSGRKGTYGVGAAPDVIYQADGTDVDWQWKEAGVVSFAMEIGSSRQGFEPDYTKWRDVTVKRQRGAWQALLRAMTDGTVKVRPSFATEGAIAARIDRLIRDPRTGAVTRESFDADAPGRTFQARSFGQGDACELKFLLPRGSYALELTDAAGRKETRFVESRGF